MSYNYKKLFIPAREMRKNQTLSEQKIWEVLKNKQINNLKFLRQKILADFIVDFYCHELKLVIEIDGEIHDKQKERDTERENYLKERFNLSIIRYTNDFILKNETKIIKEKILNDISKIEKLKY